MERMKDIKQIIAFLLCIAYPKSGNGEGQLRCHHEQFGTDHEPVEVGRSKQAWLYQPQMFCAAVCSLALAQLPEYIKSHVTMTFISVVQFCNQLGSHKLLAKTLKFTRDGCSWQESEWIDCAPRMPKVLLFQMESG